MGINSENLEFVSISTVYEDNNSDIIVAKFQVWHLLQITLLSNIIGSDRTLEINFDSKYLIQES